MYLLTANASSYFGLTSRIPTGSFVFNKVQLISPATESVGYKNGHVRLSAILRVPF
jgi:hypothetical protein